MDNKNKINEENTFALHRIRYQETQIVNICDIHLVGKEINQNDLTINLSKDYFYQEEITTKEAVKILKSASIINLVGNDIVNLALNLNLAKKNSVKIIENIPFLMIFKFIGSY